MHIKLKQHLAIATGAVSAAAVPMGADAAIGYKDNSNAFSVSYVETGSAEWDIDGAGGNDFRLFTSTASTFRYVAFDSAGGDAMAAASRPRDLAAGFSTTCRPVPRPPARCLGRP
jgi:hypothetical protein